MDWMIEERPGYFGEKRDELIAGFNDKYGPDNWRISWQWGSQILQRPEALQVYEDGYYEHFKNKPELLEWLVSGYSNVYDTAPSNVNTKFSYDIQETKSNHLHDVAIRRAVMRNGKWFSGQDLLEVRSTDAVGWVLSPCKIPFHLPDMIYQGKIKYKGQDRDFSIDPPWWIKKGVKNSVEEFYQQNKVLEIRKD